MRCYLSLATLPINAFAPINKLLKSLNYDLTAFRKARAQVAFSAEDFERCKKIEPDKYRDSVEKSYGRNRTESLKSKFGRLAFPKDRILPGLRSRSNVFYGRL